MRSQRCFVLILAQLSSTSRNSPRAAREVHHICIRCMVYTKGSSKRPSGEGCGKGSENLPLKEPLKCLKNFCTTKEFFIQFRTLGVKLYGATEAKHSHGDRCCCRFPASKVSAFLKTSRETTVVLALSKTELTNFEMCELSTAIP